MTVIDVFVSQMDFNRERTLGLLSELVEQADPIAALGWRPGAGRAHIAWQLTHIAVTEDIFGSQYLNQEKQGSCLELWDRFRGGSAPDDEVPSAEQIRAALDGGRACLLDTLATKFTDANLNEDVFFHPRREEYFTLQQVLQILTWHEPHHQGQAHLAKNLFLAR